jgi:hypothetical protein
MNINRFVVGKQLLSHGIVARQGAAISDLLPLTGHECNYCT